MKTKQNYVLRIDLAVIVFFWNIEKDAKSSHPVTCSSASCVPLDAASVHTFGNWGCTVCAVLAPT